MARNGKDSKKENEIILKLDKAALDLLDGMGNGKDKDGMNVKERAAVFKAVVDWMETRSKVVTEEQESWLEQAREQMQ